MIDKKCVLTKDDANKALDNINMWINSCDTKTSIVLGFYAAIITICLSTDFVNLQTDILTYFFDDVNFFKVIYIILHLGAILTFGIGIIELLRVVLPRIVLKTNSNEKFNSLLFYGSIAHNFPVYSKYQEEVSKITSEERLLDDLLFQVHSAAIICNKKFFLQKIGLILTIISLIVFLLPQL